MKREKTAITLIKFCIPLILSGILQQLYNWADAFIVGNVAGENALAAIGSTTTVINLFLTAITGFTLGLSILFAQKFGGRKKRSDLKDSVRIHRCTRVYFFTCPGSRHSGRLSIAPNHEYDTGNHTYGKKLSSDHTDRLTVSCRI